MNRKPDSRRTARRCRPIAAAAALFVAALLAGGPRSAASAPAGSQRVSPAASQSTEGRALRSKSTQETSERPLKRANGTGGWLQTLAALAIVIALIFGVRMLLRRFGGSARSPRRAGAIEVLAEARLASRQQVSLVRLGRRLVLVGSGPAGLSPLAEVSDPQEVAELLAAVRSGGSGRFAGLFSRYVRGEASEKGDGEPSSKGGQERRT